MVTKPGSWWRQRDPVAERFADAIVPRARVHWPEQHYPTDAADEIPAPGDVDVRQRIAADAALDPDGAFARLDRMQRRMEGQIAAARDWSADPDNVAWADHPFIGPMLEQGRGDDLMRLTDARHQESLRAAFGQTVGLALGAVQGAQASRGAAAAGAARTALGAAPSRLARSPEDEAWKAQEKNALGSPWLGVDPPMPPDPPTYRPEGYPGGRAWQVTRDTPKHNTEHRSPIAGKVLFTDDRPPFDAAGAAPIDPDAADRFFEFSPEGPALESFWGLANPTQFDLGILDRIVAAQLTHEAGHRAAHRDPWYQGRPEGSSMTTQERDAYRHAYWAYILAKALGPVASKALTDAHERVANNPAGERLKDLYNNRLLRRMAMDPGNWKRQPLDVVNEAFDSGLLRIDPVPTIGR